MRKEKKVADIAAAALSQDLWFSNQPQHSENYNISNTVSSSFIKVRCGVTARYRWMYCVCTCMSIYSALMWLII
jgi:hypothetical protein